MKKKPKTGTAPKQPLPYINNLPSAGKEVKDFFFNHLENDQTGCYFVFVFFFFSLSSLKLCLLPCPSTSPILQEEGKEVPRTNENRCCYLVIQITVPNFPARYPL